MKKYMLARMIVCYFGNIMQKLNLAWFVGSLSGNQLKFKTVMGILKERLGQSSSKSVTLLSLETKIAKVVYIIRNSFRHDMAS